MKAILLGLLMAAIPALFDPPSPTPPTAPTGCGNAKVMVVTRTADGENAPAVFQVSGDPGAGFAWAQADGAVAVAGEGEGNTIVATVNVEDPADGGGTTKHVIRMRRHGTGDPDAANRGWLGVSIGRVPESVAAQLNDGDDGVMVLNVVAGSPADRAGLQAHDIILSVGGESVDGDVGRATQLISTHKPAEAVGIVVLREGQPQTITATLGSRTEIGAAMGPGRAMWKFGGEPGEFEESIRTHGRFLQRDADGNWTMKDLGNLADLSQLPAQIQAMIPQTGNKTVQVTVNNGEKNISVSAERDGTTIEIEQAGDGPITVTRTDANGTETTATYTTREELAAGDAEASELFADTDHTVVMQLDGDGAVGGNFNFDFDFDIDTEDLHDHLMQWHEQFQQGLGQAGESYRQAMEEIHEAIERIKQEHGITGKGFGFMFGGPNANDGDEPSGGSAQRDDGHGQGRGNAPGRRAFRMFHQPRQSFEVRPDGTIESKTRRGDTEVIDVFTNEADLQQRNPELYQRYVDTRNAEH